MGHWTLEAWIEHARSLREADQESIRIDREARDKALDLARGIQEYKDEKANELREQITSERGLYVTKKDLEPMLAFMASQQGTSVGAKAVVAYVFAGIGAIVGVTGLILAAYNASHR